MEEDFEKKNLTFNELRKDLSKKALVNKKDNRVFKNTEITIRNFELLYNVRM